MSHDKSSWPIKWLDRYDDQQDPGWAGSWNGYFGKNKLCADQESYFVMDDYNNKEFNFYPDSTDQTRGGLGMQVTVRSFQWANHKLQDALFWKYNAKNIATTAYDKMIFGMVCKIEMGSTVSGYEGIDDNINYERDRSLIYCWDNLDIGFGGWAPIGYFGISVLECPGDPYDGIDNDGDAGNGPGPIISIDMFEPDTLNLNDSLIVIDYQTYQRSIIALSTDTLKIAFHDQIIELWDGKIVEEIANNRFDDNFNGLIDENNATVIGDASNSIYNYIYEGKKYINYLTGEGSENLLIDESQYDGIDNDSDWDPLTDDVGVDGIPLTGDIGEGDWIPTTASGTLLPGEPNIDKLDVDEIDKIGLSAVHSFSSGLKGLLADDEMLWQMCLPGNFDISLQSADLDFIFSSGYFSMMPNENKQLSLAMFYGYDFQQLNQNYQAVEDVIQNNYIVESTTNIQDNKNSASIRDFEIYQNYPNPFNSETVIKFRLHNTHQVKLSVYNLLGQKVKTLLNDHLNSGDHQITWDGTNDNGELMGSGIYMYRLSTDHHKKIKKMSFLK